MRCAGARSLWIERDIGPLAAPSETQLALHLAQCPDCSAWAAQAARLGADLRALHTDLPFAIDVKVRVLEQLAALPPPRREEVRTGVLAWTSSAALATAAALAAALWTLLPSASRTVRGVWLALLGLRPAAAALAEAALTQAAPVLRVLAHVTTAAHAVATTGLSPAMYTAIALAVLVMASTVAIVVGRDLRRPAGTRKEHHP